MYFSTSNIVILRPFSVTVLEEFNIGLSEAYKEQDPGIYEEMMEHPSLSAYRKENIKPEGTQVIPIRFFVPNKPYEVLALYHRGQAMEGVPGSKIALPNRPKAGTIRVTEDLNVLIADESGRFQQVPLSLIRISSFGEAGGGSKKNKA